MNVGRQIRKYRQEQGLSQDQLAEKIFVTRQSVSNWENDKTYPDLNSLILMSEEFAVSLDTLIKGDLEVMKREINVQERASFQRDSQIFSVMFVVSVLVPIPLVKYLGWYGVGIYVLLLAATLYFALKVEKHKKKFDIQTYKEIVAFDEGKSLSEIEKAREVGKRPYQKVFLVLGAGLIAGLVTILMMFIFFKML